MEAGESRFGAAFPQAINDELADSGRTHRIRRVRTALIRATRDIGGLAAEFVRSGSFARRVHGVVGRVMRRIADATGDADLLPYLLFDGEFASQLIELGRADARARHEELCALFDDVVRMRLEQCPNDSRSIGHRQRRATATHLVPPFRDAYVTQVLCADETAQYLVISLTGQVVYGLLPDARR